jgi:hypothetical protein
MILAGVGDSALTREAIRSTVSMVSIGSLPSPKRGRDALILNIGWVKRGAFKKLKPVIAYSKDRTEVALVGWRDKVHRFVLPVWGQDQTDRVLSRCERIGAHGYPS